MPANKNIRILIVDEFSTMRRIVKNLLHQLEFNYISEVSNGQAAMEKLYSERIDLVITALEMSPMTGLDVIMHIRGNSDLSKMPILVMMDQSRTDGAVASEKAGANDCIFKPFDAKDLSDKINKILR